MKVNEQSLIIKKKCDIRVHGFRKRSKWCSGRSDRSIYEA